MTVPTTVVTIDLGSSVDVAGYMNSVNIRRGRSSPAFGEFEIGTCSIQLNNESRRFDPLYSAGPYFGELVPGRDVTVVSGGVTIFAGVVADWNLDYDVSGRSVAVCQVEDALGRLGRSEFDEWTSTAGQQPGARITDALARPEVDYGGTVTVDPGLNYLQPDLVTWGSNVVNYCQLVARTDFGSFFVDRSGAVRFFDRQHYIGATAAVTFGSGSYPFEQIGVSYGSELLYNRVQVDRVNGDVQAVTDATSATAYGVRSLTYTELLLEDDVSALDLANQLLAVYKDPLYRVESVRINAGVVPAGANQTALLGVDIGSVVDVGWTPNGVGSAIARTCVAEGVQHSISPVTHHVTFTLNDSSIFQLGNFWTVADATFGVINGGTGVFNYPVSF